MSNDYKSILNRLLDNIDNTLDKRQGSIIYDALAPAAMELAQCYTALDIYTNQTYLKTATGVNLDNRVADYNLTRKSATNAIRLVNVYNNNNELYDIDIGSRFSIPEEYGGYDYVLTEKIETGKYKAECETPGTVGNTYLGVLLPLYNIANLGKAEIIGTFQAGEDIETDESLRARALSILSKDAFGGNQADYKRYLDTIDGVGPAKIFPVWNGGGTVKISFVNSDYTIPDASFIAEVQELIDPIHASRQRGVGLAPIGHYVTVVAPTATSINIGAGIELVDGYELSDVQDEIKANISSYIAELGENWANASTLTVYRSKIVSYILKTDEVINVLNVTIDGIVQDLTLTENATTQQFPVIGEILLYTIEDVI